MKKPEECNDIQDIRTEIDRIDQEIISLLGNRYQYVQSAAKFKKDEQGVKAPDRVKSMLAKRRGWAEQAGLDPDMIEEMYTNLVNFFIKKEMDHWKDKG